LAGPQSQIGLAHDVEHREHASMRVRERRSQFMQIRVSRGVDRPRPAPEDLALRRRIEADCKRNRQSDPKLGVGEVSEDPRCAVDAPLRAASQLVIAEVFHASEGELARAVEGFAEVFVDHLASRRGVVGWTREKPPKFITP
jgi:hypothetical protein